MDKPTTLSYRHRNLQDKHIDNFLKETVVPDLASCQNVLVDLSFHRFTINGLKKIVNFMESHEKVTEVCVGYNHFQFPEFYKELAAKQHTEWVEQRRINLGQSEEQKRAEQVFMLQQESSKQLKMLEQVLEQVQQESSKRLKMLEQVQQESSKRLKIQEAKDPAEQLRQMKQYKDTDDMLVEQCVTSAVAAQLTDPVIIKAMRYAYEGAVADLDGLVVGQFNDEEVVVLCEAKHNMNNGIRKAQVDLFASQRYWEQLCGLDPQDPAVDEGRLADYVNLEVADNKSRRVMLAFGGAMFSQDIAENKLRGLVTPWFYVSANPAGKFVAVYNPGKDDNG
eukprot:CAMPEP_0202919708 /NCGR_PEP_ID=MMETSP1392-20130828/76475_1 /ASSEMBLY_ACC=CAM_ASM_000868 /TAXON_ID=225041 /ORGANISM="Chlamydomonas chlamydogama, Strain SAG 11-48b" /LENGTH=335 /DNA_ID=CAMNT_0049613165 /DNA_START=219 /DNA_END=1226 /DNA_ORIENTATION=-